MIGSDPNECGENSIILQHPDISPCHASIRWKEGNLYIQDQGKGEVWLQDELMVANSAKILPNHCTIRFGSLAFEYVLEFPPAWPQLMPSTFQEPTVSVSQAEPMVIVPPPEFANKGMSVSSPPPQHKVEEHGFVIAEFILLSLDASCALPHHCEILSHRPQFLIGRSSQCDYQIEFGEKYVAEEQAMIQYFSQEQSFAIKGLVKENPIFVNDHKVLDTMRLKPGDVIKLGIAKNAPEIRFSLTEPEKTPAPTRVPQQFLFSEIVATPIRGEIYGIGSYLDGTFVIQDPSVPSLIAEIMVPDEGEYFLVRKVCDSSIPVLLDGEELLPSIQPETRYGVNQLLQIGDYLIIRNNHRTLPPELTYFVWKKFFSTVLWFLFIALLVVGGYLLIQEYWPKLNFLISWQSRLKEYQKNVFYLMVFDREGKSSFSGTGFLLTQKDVQEQDIYYIITCKHVIEPWKFDKHQIKDGQIYNSQNEVIGKLNDKGQNESYYIAAWPYGSNAIDPDPQSQHYLFENSFTNADIPQKLGNIEIYKLGKDTYEQVDDFQQHVAKTNDDIAILKLTLKPGSSALNYYRWCISEKKSFDIGESLVVMGYSLGGARLLNKQGMVVPVSCEGKLTSDCQTPGFLEMNVNQTQGASGGPIVNTKSEIVGMVAFSDREKRLVYGIHAQILIELLK